MSDVYTAWKPLRNFLAKLDVNDSLSVIRYYTTRKELREPRPIPSDLRLHPWADKENCFLPWDLETLAREVIISSGVTYAPKYTFRNPDHLANAINKLMEIDEYIAQSYLNKDNIRHEVSVRLSHRQFKYQTDRPSLASLIRYYKIFNDLKLRDKVTGKIGLPPQKLYTIGAALWSHYTKLYGMNYPLEDLDMTDIDETDYSTFMEYFSIPMDVLREKLISQDERKLDERFFYGYHSLYSYPIILTSLNGVATHVCPSPTLLYWRITSGVYYDLVTSNDFGNNFGAAFEDYVGSVIKKELENVRDIKYYPGEKNSPSSPNRCDWLIEKPGEYLIVECKTKRLSMGAKTNLSDKTELDNQLNKLADALLQAYLSLLAYVDGKYRKPSVKWVNSNQAYICVTTLEKWYLLGPQNTELDRLLREKIRENGLDEALIDKNPYVVMPVDDFELMCYLMKNKSIKEIIEPYVLSRDQVGWEFGQYLNKSFDELGEYIYAFDDDIQDLFTVKLDLSKRLNRKRQENKG